MSLEKQKKSPEVNVPQLLKDHGDALSEFYFDDRLAAAEAERLRKNQLEKGFRENRFQANEHIVSPDGEIGEFPDGVIPHSKKKRG